MLFETIDEGAIEAYIEFRWDITGRKNLKSLDMQFHSATVEFQSGVYME